MEVWAGLGEAWSVLVNKFIGKASFVGTRTMKHEDFQGPGGS